MDCMQAFSDYYRILQVHHEAGQEVIEAAYKRLCRIYHPDLNRAPGSDERMKEINEAHDVLGSAVARRSYHREWLAATARSGARPPFTAAHGAGAETRQDSAELARAALDGYFRCLMDSQWDPAYAMLTLADQRHVPLLDFREWKNTVSENYRIGSWAIKPFRKYTSCTIAGSYYREVHEFSVFICDMDGAGRVSEENYLKYVALDGGMWRVCLGYADLKPLILRFKYMAENASSLDPAEVYAEAVLSHDAQTGLLSRKGFLEKAEAEAVRSRRYGNIFSVALLIVRPEEEAPVFTDREYARMCVAHAAKVIAPVIRQTDLLARWGETEIALLFTETPRENAGFAMEKLLDRMGQRDDLKYSIAYGLAEFDGMVFEDTMAAASSDAQVRKYMLDGVTKTFITINDYS